MTKRFINLLLLTNFSYLYASQGPYSISVCTTSNLENAQTCKRRILKDLNEEVFIIKERENRFVTYLGHFDTPTEANIYIKNSSDYVKSQQPFSKMIEKPIEKKIEKTLEIPILKPIEKEKTELANLEEKSIFDQEISRFNEILIEVDSKTNTMIVKAKENENFTTLNTYVVSTGKNDIKKPLGLGRITEITLNPTWYPTQDTLKTFKKRGINLPKVVPGGHRLNYMGSAKINLTHKVDGNQTFRIHGTINETTIGTNESSGCIRMKNDEVVQLANLLKDFSKTKSLKDITVYLK